jgi:dGTPase
MRAQSSELKQFLLRNLYRHPQVMETTEAGQQVVRDLFAAYAGRSGADAGRLRRARDRARRRRLHRRHDRPIRRASTSG